MHPGYEASIPPPSDGAPPDAGSDGGIADAAEAGPGGVALWYGFYGDGNNVDGRSVAVDGTGNVLYAGYFQGTVNFGGTPLTATGGSSDIFVAKFDGTGRQVWSESFGDDLVQLATGIAVDALGNSFVTATNTGTIDFGTGTPVTSAGAEDVVVAKLDPTGKALWAKDFGDASSQLSYGIATDAAGNVLVVGAFQGSITFDATPLTSAGGYDIFVAKLDTNGNTLWSKSYGDASDQFAMSVAADATGNLGIAGSLEGTVNFGAGPITSAGGKDALAFKLGPTGTLLFAKAYGDALDQLGDGVAFDAAGNAFVAGDMEGTVNFGKGPVTANSDGAKFLVKLDPTGNTLWSQGFGDGNVYDWTAVAVDPAGNATMVGEFWNTITIGSDMLMSKDKYDIFVAGFDPNGQVLWDARYGAASDQFARTVATNAAGDVVMGGYFLGRLGFTSGGGMNAPNNGLLYLVELTR